MAKQLSEETQFTLSVKTMAGASILIFTMVGFWFSLQAQIDGKLDKAELPEPKISRVEFDIKDKMVRNQIKAIDENVKLIQAQLEKMEERLYQISTK